MGEVSLIAGAPAMAAPDSAGSWKVRPGAALGFGLLWLFLVAIYARPEDIFPSLGALHLTFLLGVLAAVAFVWSLFLGHVTVVWPRELRLMLLLTLWFAAGMPFAYWRGGSFLVFTQIWLKTVVIFFLMVQILVTLERVRWVLWAIILSELAVTAYSLLESSGVRWVEGRMYGVSQGILGWNFLGIAAALTLPYIAALFIAHRSWVKSCLLAVTTLSMLWMLMLTASRSGTLDVAVSVLVTSVLVLRGSARGRLIGAGILLALVISIVMAPAVFWERMGTISGNETAASGGSVTASAEMSENDRMAVLKRSVDYTWSHPIFGLGMGNVQVVSGNEARQSDAWVGSHNTFTELSAEGGVPALLLFLGLLFTALRGMKRIGNAALEGPEGNELSLMARATRASLLAFLFAGCFAHLGYEYFLYTGPIAVAVGLQQVAARRAKAAAPTVASLAGTQPLPGWNA